MSCLPFAFPVLGFGRPAEPWDTEQLQAFRTPEHFEVCGAWTQKHNWLVGMDLVDADGRSWEIVDATYRELTKKTFWDRMFGGYWPYFEVQLSVEPRGSTAFGTVQARVCAAIDADPFSWSDEELTAGEAGEPIDEATQTAELKERVRAARSLAELLDVLELVDGPL